MQTRLIGITGLSGAGKDTTADFFVRFHGYERYSLATPIKLALNAMFGWEMWQWNDRKWKEAVLPEFGKSPRQMAQTLGTDWGRDLINSNLWLTLAENYIRSSVKPIVIPDVRFDNEATLVHALGGELIRVVRDGVAPVSPHVSEQGVASLFLDWEFRNNGSIDDLHQKLWTAFK